MKKFTPWLMLILFVLVLMPFSAARAESSTVCISRLVQYRDLDLAPASDGGVPIGAKLRLQVTNVSQATYYMWYLVDAAGEETQLAASDSDTLIVPCFDESWNGTYVVYAFPVEQDVMNRKNVLENGRITLGALHAITEAEAPEAPASVSWGVRGQDGMLLIPSAAHATGYRVTLYAADGTALYGCVVTGSCCDLSEQIQKYAARGPLTAGVSSISGHASLADSAETLSPVYQSDAAVGGTLPVFTLEEICDDGSFRLGLTAGSLDDAMYRIDVSTAEGTGVVWTGFVGWQYAFPADLTFHYDGELTGSVMLRFYYALRGDPSAERYVTVTLNPQQGVDVAAVSIGSEGGITVTQRSGEGLPSNTVYTDARTVVTAQPLYITDDGQYLRQTYAKDLVFDEDGASVASSYGGHTVNAIAKPVTYKINPEGEFDVNGQAHFTLTRQGGYTLHVTYLVYEWTDGGWVATGQTFEREVGVLAEEPPVPATDDISTPWLFVGIAIVAAGSMGALLVLRRRIRGGNIA